MRERDIAPRGLTIFAAIAFCILAALWLSMKLF